MSRTSPKARRRQGRTRGKTRSTTGWWWLLVIVGLVVVVALGRSLAGAARGSSMPDEVGCSPMEQLSYHVHMHLTIFVDGRQVPVTSNVGIRPDCIFWLHTHQADGVIHVEAASPHTYPLGAFFRVWGQRLDSTHLLDRSVDGQHQIVAYVNGQQYLGRIASRKR